jgi:hypothetical protein
MGATKIPTRISRAYTRDRTPGTLGVPGIRVIPVIPGIPGIPGNPGSGDCGHTRDLGFSGSRLHPGTRVFKDPGDTRVFRDPDIFGIPA